MDIVLDIMGPESEAREGVAEEPLEEEYLTTVRDSLSYQLRRMKTLPLQLRKARLWL